MPQYPSFLALLATPSSRPKGTRPPTQPPSATPPSKSTAKDVVPLNLWLQAGGTGPPPPWPEFLSRAKKRAERTRFPLEAAEAWDREKKKAFKSVEDVWGKRGVIGGGRPKRRELVRWYRGYLAGRKEDGKGKEDVRGKGGEKEGDKGERVEVVRDGEGLREEEEGKEEETKGEDGVREGAPVMSGGNGDGDVVAAGGEEGEGVGGDGGGDGGAGDGGGDEGEAAGTKGGDEGEDGAA